MTTYWLIGEKSMNNNLQQTDSSTTSGHISTLQDQSSCVTMQNQVAQSKQQEPHVTSVIQHRLQAQSDQHTVQSNQSPNQEPRPGYPSQQRSQESQHQGLTTLPRNPPIQTNSTTTLASNQIQNQKSLVNPSTGGLIVTGNGAPKSVVVSRNVVATSIGNASPSRNRTNVASSVNNPMHQTHQIYPTAESMPNHTESGPNAPLLLPAGAVPRV